MTTVTNKNALNLPKPPHRIQTKILAEQGLLADPDRGIDNATSVRESPSSCFGITTPGRRYTDRATDDLLRRTTEFPNIDPTTVPEKAEYGRKGGHQFIMDDGDVDGNSRRFKLRSAAGHQIIMDDTSGFMYISTATGKNWIELANDGQMFIYAGNDISVRTEGNLNLKIGGDYNLEVDGNYNRKVRGNTKTETTDLEQVITGECDIDIAQTFSLTAGVDIALEAGTDVGITAGTEMAFDSGADSGWKAGGDLNLESPAIGFNTTSPPSPVTPTVPASFTLTDLNDTIKVGDIWKHEAPSAATEQTILPQIPTHEPYGSVAVTPLVSSTGQPSKKV